MSKIIISILLIVLSNVAIARTATCSTGTSVVAFFNLPQNQREIDCFKNDILVEGFTEALLPMPVGPNWTQFDYIKGYAYSNSVYASICHVTNNDTNTCAFNIFGD
jgi:hypothetical protein